MSTPTPAWGDQPGQPTPAADGLGTSSTSGPQFASPSFGSPYGQDPGATTAPLYASSYGTPAYPSGTATPPTMYEQGHSAPGQSTPTYLGYDPNSAPSPGYGPSTSYQDPYAGAGYPAAGYAQPQPYPEPSYAQTSPYAAPGYQGYGLAPYSAGVIAPPSTGMAVASMVCGIVGLVFGMCMWLLPASIAAIVLGAVTLQRVKRGEAGGRGMAIAGIATGSAGVAFSGLFILLMVIGAMAS